MELFYAVSGDGHTVEFPNDLKDIDINVNGQDIVRIYGVHSGDGRVGTTEYTIDIQKSRSDQLDKFELDSYDYVKIKETGLWRGDMRLSVITLTEVEA